MGKKSTADRLAIGHHIGNNIWGYEVFPDGRIELSPGFCDRIRSVLDRENGLLAMQENFNRFVASELGRISKEKREWWSDLTEDTGVNGSYNFDTQKGNVSPVKPTETNEPPAQ